MSIKAAITFTNYQNPVVLEVTGENQCTLAVSFPKYFSVESKGILNENTIVTLQRSCNLYKYLKIKKGTVIGYISDNVIWEEVDSLRVTNTKRYYTTDETLTNPVFYRLFIKPGDYKQTDSILATLQLEDNSFDYSIIQTLIQNSTIDAETFNGKTAVESKQHTINKET